MEKYKFLACYLLAAIGTIVASGDNWDKAIAWILITTGVLGMLILLLVKAGEEEKINR